MIKNILFDMGGVIFRQDTEEAFRRFEQAGINPQKYMGAYGQKDFFLDIETGAINEEEFCRRMAVAAGRTSVEHDEAEWCWLGFIKDVPVDRLHHLLELRRQGYHVCLLSNTNPFIMGFTCSNRFSTEEKPITHYFESLFCSYLMHAYKPNAEIFEKALATDSMQANECLFLDDSIKNVEAAAKLGLSTIHVQTNEDWWEKLGSKLEEQAR